MSFRDKLQIFVSSTIAECADERREALSAIASLNHEGFLFEAAGARPYPPRELYLPKLGECDVFVAIYKNSYGWIADGQTISGLEEEYRFAMQRGMPCLVYVHADARERDSRLTAMLTDIQAESQLTYSRYSLPHELYSRIRDDLSALIAQRFLRAGQLEARVKWDADQELLAAAEQNLLLPRPELESALINLLHVSSDVQVVGDSGIGKTTLLASASKHSGFEYVSAAKLSTLELINVIVSKLSRARQLIPDINLTLEGGYETLDKEIDICGSQILVLDALEEVSLLKRIIDKSRRSGSGFRVVYSLARDTYSDSGAVLEVPPFSKSEVEQFLHLRNVECDADQLQQVVYLTGGSPLLLQYCTFDGDVKYDSRLAELDKARLMALTARAREITTYVALAEPKLGLQDLLHLVVGQDVGPENIASDVAAARWFIREEPTGYRIRLDHQRGAVLAELEKSPQREAFYRSRTADLLARQGDYIAAFLVLDTGKTSSIAEVARQALFDAERRGDYRNINRIAARLLELGREGSTSYEDQVVLRLAMVKAEQQLGNDDRAATWLAEARSAAQESKSNRLMLIVDEEVLWRELVSSLNEDSLRGIYDLRESYRRAGDQFSFARLTLEISALLIRLDRYKEAVDEARLATAIFDSLDDGYGVSLASRNLASALSALPGHEAEADELLRQFSNPETNTARERAWLCNVLTRRLRRNRDFYEAERYAKEAIQIGDMLGDRYLVAINSINLANVYRDLKQYTQALEFYGNAHNIGRQIGEREIEASSARLMASMYFRLDQFDLALQHAVFAVGLLRSSAAVSEFANCLEQLGDINKGMRRYAEAVTSYTEAATAIVSTGDEDERWRLAERALDIAAVHATPDEYLRTVESLCGSKVDAETAGTVVEQFYASLFPLLAQVSEHYVIGILGPYFRLLFADIPAPLSKFVFELISINLVAADRAEKPIWQKLFPLIPLLTAVPVDAIGLKDLIDAGERISDRVAGLFFKPHLGGAPHWVLTMELEFPVVVSITSLDDEIETASACTLIALFLKSFEADIKSRIAPKNVVGLTTEVRISIGNSVSMPADLASEVAPLMKGQPCALFLPSKPADDPVPAFLIVRQGISAEWVPGTGQVSALQAVFGDALTAFIFQLFRGDIELDVLRPKMAAILRETIS